MHDINCFTHAASACSASSLPHDPSPVLQHTRRALWRTTSVIIIGAALENFGVFGDVIRQQNAPPSLIHQARGVPSLVTHPQLPTYSRTQSQNIPYLLVSTACSRCGLHSPVVVVIKPLLSHSIRGPSIPTPSHVNPALGVAFPHR